MEVSKVSPLLIKDFRSVALLFVLSMRWPVSDSERERQLAGTRPAVSHERVVINDCIA